MTNDKVYETIRQIELTKKSFKMLDDLNRVAYNCLGLIKKLSYAECVEVLAKCENIPLSTKHDLVERAKKQNDKEWHNANINQLEYISKAVGILHSFWHYNIHDDFKHIRKRIFEI